MYEKEKQEILGVLKEYGLDSFDLKPLSFKEHETFNKELITYLRGKADFVFTFQGGLENKILLFNEAKFNGLESKYKTFSILHEGFHAKSSIFSEYERVYKENGGRIKGIYDHAIGLLSEIYAHKETIKILKGESVVFWKGQEPCVENDNVCSIIEELSTKILHDSNKNRETIRQLIEGYFYPLIGGLVYKKVIYDVSGPLLESAPDLKDDLEKSFVRFYCGIDALIKIPSENLFDNSNVEISAKKFKDLWDEIGKRLNENFNMAN